MNKEHPKWNFQEFSAFLMLYAAAADLKITNDEVQAILQKVDQSSYDEIAEEFHSLVETEKLDLIMSYKGLYFPTAAQTNELLDLVKKDFLADGTYSLMEKNLMRVLQKLM